MEERRTSVFENGLIWFGAGVSLAEILPGTYFAPLGFRRGLAAILLGHLIGCVMLFAAGLIGGRTGKSAMETAAAVRLAIKIARARRTVFPLIFRCRNSVKSFSLSMENTVEPIIRKVVVLMPPAVPEGDPPINMRTKAIIQVLFRNPFWEIV